MRILLSIFISGLFWACSSKAPSKIEFWVSPQGNDAAQGTQDEPFATIAQAQQAVRLIPGNARKDIKINIQGGQYRLTGPLTFEPQDSGQAQSTIVYQAALGEHPVISGSIAVTGWTLADATNSIYKASVGQVKTRHLYVNGNRRTRARTGNYPAGFYPHVPSGGIQFIPTPLNSKNWNEPTQWTNPKNIEAVISTQWKMMRVPLDSINSICSACTPPTNAPSTNPGLIKLQEPAWSNANLFLGGNPPAPGIWSFWQVTWFENAYQFLDEPGEWYLDETAGTLYYIPMPGENMSQASVELPVLETLITGTASNIRFQGLTFAYTTWLGSSSNNGYVADQSGQLLVGTGYKTNLIGHVQNTVSTPSSISFRSSHNIEFRGNIFQHLGSVGLGFGAGSQDNVIQDNLFTDISSAAIQLGGVTALDAHPSDPGQIVFHNLIHNNLIRKIGQEYYDAAGIFVGFSQSTTVSNNTIVDVPWSGIAIGWGWGLLDPGAYAGVPNAAANEWGTYDKPTPNSKNQIVNNRIHAFLGKLWDAGAIYTTGQQGSGPQDNLLIQGNVATSKRPSAGGNTFYTDGGSRYITLKQNVSLNNPIGVMDFGPRPNSSDPFYNTAAFSCPESLKTLCILAPLFPYDLDNLPYGNDTGGCRTYGDITYDGNYLSSDTFYNICLYTDPAGVSHPTNMTKINKVTVTQTADVPVSILNAAGVQSTPATIPSSEWILPDLPL